MINVINSEIYVIINHFYNVFFLYRFQVLLNMIVLFVIIVCYFLVICFLIKRLFTIYFEGKIIFLNYKLLIFKILS